MPLFRPVLMIAAILLPASSTSHAQTLLRWKLKAGETFIVAIDQQTESQVGFSAKSATSKINLGMQVRWNVTHADESAITFTQTIERLTASLTAATASADYDSAVKSRPVGLAKQLGESLQPLIGAEIAVVMTPRGEVTSVKPANEAAEKLFVPPANPTEPSGASSGTVRQAVSQSIVRLPDQEVKAGDQWTAARELSTPAGPVQHETTYTLEQSVDRDSKQLLPISIISLLKPQTPIDGNSPLPAAATKIKSHEQTGTILFSAEQGRVVEAEQTQKLVTERAYRDTVIAVTLTSTQKTTIEPVTRP